MSEPAAGAEEQPEDAIKEVQIRMLRLARAQARHTALGGIAGMSRWLTGMDTPPHQRLMCSAMEAVWRGKIQRLMVFAPPRHTKSWTISWAAPLWFYIQNPRLRVLHLTHTKAFARRFGRRLRNSILHPAWPAPDKVSLSRTKRADDEWETKQGGEYYAAGMDGGVSGRPADVLLSDDIIRGYEMAQSALQRDKVWDIYNSECVSRLEGPQLQIMTLTRWHEDDPPGRILPLDYDGKSGWVEDRETGAPWYVIRLPARADRADDPTVTEKLRGFGDWLWPSVHGDQQEIANQERRGGQIWQSLYQQNPTSEMGLYIKRDHFRYYDFRLDRPEWRALFGSLAIYIASDFAVKDKDRSSGNPDFHAHLVFGVDPRWRIYLLDLWHHQADTEVSVNAWLNLVQKWQPILSGFDNDQIVGSIGPFMNRLMLEKGIMCQRSLYSLKQDKAQRAQSMIGFYASHRVYHPRGASWVPTLERELLGFPTARKDDIWDAAGIMGRMVNDVIEGSVPKDDRNAPPMSMDRLWREHEEEARR